MSSGRSSYVYNIRLRRSDRLYILFEQMSNVYFPSASCLFLLTIYVAIFVCMLHIIIIPFQSNKTRNHNNLYIFELTVFSNYYNIQCGLVQDAETAKVTASV